jgi:tRNA A37 threonylcarbamoyladenosine dehydratase
LSSETTKSCGPESDLACHKRKDLMHTYEVIVVGCGGLGSAALYWLSREIGSLVLGIMRSAVTDESLERAFHA